MLLTRTTQRCGSCSNPVCWLTNVLMYFLGAPLLVTREMWRQQACFSPQVDDAVAYCSRVGARSGALLRNKGAGATLFDLTSSRSSRLSAAC